MWINLYRRKRINRFISLIKSYENKSHLDWQVDGRIEKEGAESIREDMNLMISQIDEIVKSTDNSSIVVSFPAPSVGGHVKNINLFDNIFNLHSFQITFDDVINQLNRAKGVLKTNFINSIIRTINPIYWISIIIEYIVNLPFRLVGIAGFDSDKFEKSIIGRALKGLLYIIMVVASIITILQAFQLWDDLINFYKISTG